MKSNNEVLLWSLVKSSLLKWISLCMLHLENSDFFFSLSGLFFLSWCGEKCLCPSQSVEIRWFLNSFSNHSDFPWFCLQRCEHQMNWNTLKLNNILIIISPPLIFCVLFRSALQNKMCWQIIPTTFVLMGKSLKNIPKTTLGWLFTSGNINIKMCWVRTHPDKCRWWFDERKICGGLVLWPWSARKKSSAIPAPVDTGLPKGAQLSPNAALMNWEMPLTILASALQGQLVFAFLFFLFKIKMRTISRVLMVLLREKANPVIQWSSFGNLCHLYKIWIKKLNKSLDLGTFYIH